MALSHVARTRAQKRRSSIEYRLRDCVCVQADGTYVVCGVPQAAYHYLDVYSKQHTHAERIARLERAFDVAKQARRQRRAAEAVEAAAAAMATHKAEAELPWPTGWKTADELRALKMFELRAELQVSLGLRTHATAR
jgi:hypothetical protein